MIRFLSELVFFFFFLCGDFRLYAPIRATLHLTQGVAPVVKALVLKVCSFKVQGSTLGEKPAIYPDPCRETSEGLVYGSLGISRGAHKLT